MVHPSPPVEDESSAEPAKKKVRAFEVSQCSLFFVRSFRSLCQFNCLQRREESPSRFTEQDTVNYGGQPFLYQMPPPPHQLPLSMESYPSQMSSYHSLLQQRHVFPGQSPPLFGLDNAMQMQMAPASLSQNYSPGMTQPVVATHLSHDATYATVPYPYHISYPSGQPLIQHTDGHFYPAIVNVVSMDQRDTPPDDVNPLTRIVDNPPNPPDSALGRPKRWIRWNETEDTALKMAVEKYGEEKMALISRRIFYNTRDVNQCRQRWRKSLQPGLAKGKFTKEEDVIIIEMVKASQGSGKAKTKWTEIAKRLPGRLAEQVKTRWTNDLDPEIKTGVWTKTEMDLLVETQKELGNKWADIAKRIPGRSEQNVKNRWYNMKTSMKRKAEREAAEARDRRRLAGFHCEWRSSTESTETVPSLIFKSEERSI